MKKNIYNICIGGMLIVLVSCAYSKKFPAIFYKQNEQQLVSIKDQFKELYSQHPFTVLFEEKSFTHISFEFIGDTITYIYHFNINENAFADSLHTHGYNVDKIKKLVVNMKAVQCTWITSLAYYENLEEKELVLMAVRNKALNSTIKGESYCTLAFFETPQPYNEKDIFLDGLDKKIRRKINGHLIKKLNDKVGYAVTKQYR